MMLMLSSGFERPYRARETASAAATAKHQATRPLLRPAGDVGNAAWHCRTRNGRAAA
jgi:hypothetical protein